MGEPMACGQRGEKRRIAAIAAALAFMGEQAPEGEAREGRAALPARHYAGGRSPSSPWALYGRQQIMHMRGLLQRRAVRR